MNVKIKITIFICFITSTASYANIQNYIESSFDLNYKLSAMDDELSSSSLLEDTSNFYWMPKGIVSNKIKKIHTLDEIRDELTFSVSSKLAGSGVLDNIKQSKLNSEKVRLRVEKEKNIISNNILKNFISILIYQQAIKKAEQLLKSSKNINSKISNNYISGLSSKSDVEQANLLLVRINNEIQVYESQKRTFILNIERISGVKFNTILLRNHDLIKYVGYSILDTDITKNFDLRMAVIDSELYRIRSTKTPLNWKANLKLETKSREYIREEAYIELEFTVDLFDYNRHKNINSDGYLYSSKNKTQQWMLNDLENSLYLLVENRKNNTDELLNIRSQIELSEQISTTLQDDYNSGNVDFFQMLSNEKEILSLLGQKMQLEVNDINYFFDTLILTGSNLLE